MCGIAVIAGKNLDEHRYKIDDMLNVLSRRGPDGIGQHRYTSCWLGHRRLSIVDIPSGAQPMVDANLCITFNGEIYNYKDLRGLLQTKGYQFSTDSDTEVILKAYREWGSECPVHLDGMFAFAIWDEGKQELFVARDRLGKKPLYYSFDSTGVLLLASEIKALHASGAINLILSQSAIDDYLRLMYVPPGKSVYENVEQVSPAHCGTYTKGKLILRRYWSLPTEKLDSISYAEAKYEVTRLLTKAVKKRMDACDVEIGTFLSGGLDSSLVTILASQCTDNQLKTFSIGYLGHDESPYSRKVSDLVGSNHSETELGGCMSDELDSILSYFDEPHADTSDFPQHILSRRAAKEVKVVLSGDGADELFYGYKWYRKQSKEDSLFERRISDICAFTSDARMELWGSEKSYESDSLVSEIRSSSLDPLDKVGLFDLMSHLPGQILTKVDRAGMMHGLEVRSPFLDTELVEYVFSLPSDLKIRDGEQKSLLKDILCDYMPHDFAYRKKQGFGAPIEMWLRQKKIEELVRSTLGSGSRICSLFSGSVINTHINEFYMNSVPHVRAAQRLWVLLCLGRWLENSHSIS